MRKLGQIPILSKYFVRLRIQGAKKSIRKAGNRISDLVEKQRKKIDEIVAAANRTDSARLINEAKALRNDLEKVSCVKVKFREEPITGAPKRVSAPSTDDVSSECIEAVTIKTRGRVIMHPGRGGWSDEERRLFKECEEKGGPNGWKWGDEDEEKGVPKGEDKDKGAPKGEDQDKGGPKGEEQDKGVPKGEGKDKGGPKGEGQDKGGPKGKDKDKVSRDGWSEEARRLIDDKGGPKK